MDLVAASVIAFVTFGAPVGAAAWWIFGRPWVLTVQISVLGLLAVALWVPAFALGGLLSEMLPLDWGHAGIGYFIGYCIGTVLAAVVLVTWLVRRRATLRG
jgi:hypothetical protein